MADYVQRIRSAVIDGRAQTARHIQHQLSNLYHALQAARPALHNALRRDSDYSAGEADAEIFLSLQAAREEYEAVNVAQVLEQEYRLAHGKDNLSRRVPVGCVYLVPSQHSRLYSVIQPACAAIAAGNCVMVEIGQTLSELGPVLRNVFAEAMDNDSFAVVDSKPNDPDFFSTHCVVVDGQSESSDSTASTLSAPRSRTVAIVDRTSTIRDAAGEIVRARFAFRGRSPYAPDVVLVNEFALQEFCSAAARYATDHIGVEMATGNPRKAKTESSSDLQQELHTSDVTTLISGARGSIVVVADRDSHLLQHKISEPVLLVVSIKSLDDGIDLANARGSQHLATYLFAAPPAAKYLSQFIDSRASFTNHIPVDLLVGAAAPAGFPTAVQARHSKEMFSQRCPEYITPSSYHALLTQLLDHHDPDGPAPIQAALMKSLPPMNEPDGKQMGFFEQGLLTGGVVAVTSALAGVAVMVRYVGPAVLRRIR